MPRKPAAIIVLTKDDIERAAKMAAVGVNNDQLADYFEVSHAHWDVLLKRTPELRKAIKKARSGANVAMGATLFQRAMRGDTAAAIFWLKTQGRWREVSQAEAAGNTKRAVKLNYSIDDEEKKEDATNESEAAKETEDEETEDEDGDEVEIDAEYEVEE